jgi:hypothetical protein
MTPMDRYKYFRMKLELFPPDIIDKYGLRDKVDANGNVFCKVQRGMYGLPQAGIIAQDLLTKRLNKAGYQQSKIMPGYWRHGWCPISFTLVVDNFGVKYIDKNNVEHLTTQSTPTGKERNTLDLHSIGTIPSARCISPCQGTLKMPSSVSAMNHQTNRRCNHIPTQLPLTVRQYNRQRQPTHHQRQPRQRRNTFGR